MCLRCGKKGKLGTAPWMVLECGCGAVWRAWEGERGVVKWRGAFGKDAWDEAPDGTMRVEGDL